MTNKESLFAGLHILMRAIPDGPAVAGRRLGRYWYRESRCQVRTGWQKLCHLCGYKSVKICVDPWVIFRAFLWLINPFNPRNPRKPLLIKDLSPCKALYNSRDSSTDDERSLQNHLFMQNKPNFRKSQMNVNTFITMNYEQRTMNYEIKNKPNSNPIQSQFKPNTKPIQTQNEPKTNPIQTQTNPTCSELVEPISNNVHSM